MPSGRPSAHAAAACDSRPGDGLPGPACAHAWIRIDDLLPLLAIRPSPQKASRPRLASLSLSLVLHIDHPATAPLAGSLRSTRKRSSRSSAVPPHPSIEAHVPSDSGEAAAATTHGRTHASLPLRRPHRRPLPKHECGAHSTTPQKTHTSAPTPDNDCLEPVSLRRVASDQRGAPHEHAFSARARQGAAPRRAAPRRRAVDRPPRGRRRGRCGARHAAPRPPPRARADPRCVTRHATHSGYEYSFPPERAHARMRMRMCMCVASLDVAGSETHLTAADHGGPKTALPPHARAVRTHADGRTHATRARLARPSSSYATRHTWPLLCRRRTGPRLHPSSLLSPHATVVPPCRHAAMSPCRRRHRTLLAGGSHGNDLVSGDQMLFKEEFLARGKMSLQVVCPLPSPPPPLLATTESCGALPPSMRHAARQDRTP